MRYIIEYIQKIKELLNRICFYLRDSNGAWEIEIPSLDILLHSLSSVPHLNHYKCDFPDIQA